MKPAIQAWQRFVLDYGDRARGYELAAVLDKTVVQVERVRRTRACTPQKKKKYFAELFALWRGRAPRAEDWPKPRRFHLKGFYQWQPPELAYLATLVGQLDKIQIAKLLTVRLQKLTGDPKALRTPMSVQLTINRIGLVATDLIGGITAQQAAKEIGSYAIVHQAIQNKVLPARKVGIRLLIPYEAWAAFKAKRVLPPKGFVQLSTIKRALGIRSDKLPEFAKLGHIPTAILCTPVKIQGRARSGQRGSWYIDRKVARQIVADRRAGRPMPWHGKVLPTNSKHTFALMRQRAHPASCSTCAQIWGGAGAPKDLEDFMRRYPPLLFGAKKHLTRKWTPGLTILEVSNHCNRSVGFVARALDAGALPFVRHGRWRFVTKTEATRWKARKCPSGYSEKSWVSLAGAAKQYAFTRRELRRFIDSGKLKSKLGTFGAANGITYVLKHQCAVLRERLGFTEKQAAQRVGVSIPTLRILLAGVDRRGATKLPLMTVQACIKRLNSQQGHTLEEAARELEMPVQWVRGRILDGTIRIQRARWDRRRLYVTGPMLARLREAKRKPAKFENWTDAWMLQTAASMDAGVSAGTLVRWAVDGEVRRRKGQDGWRYARKSVRARARLYWKTVRFHRATPPAWLLKERAGRAANDPAFPQLRAA